MSLPKNKGDNNETEALKREIDYLSNLINNHGERPSKMYSTQGTERTNVCCSRKAKDSRLTTQGKNPYKYDRLFPVADKTPVTLFGNYKLVKKREKAPASSTQSKVMKTEYSAPQNPGSRYRWKMKCSNKIVKNWSPQCFSRLQHFAKVPCTVWSKNSRGCFRSRRVFCSYRMTRRKNKNVTKQTTHLTSINGLLYRVSRTKLSREIKKIDDCRSRKGKTIFVRGVKYRMDPTGKTLTRVGNPTDFTRKRIDLGRKTYIQTSPVLWTKTGAATARQFASRVLHRSIHRVLTSDQRKRLSKDNRYCMFYNRFGKCLKRNQCPFLHDPEKVAVCTRFLRGTCKGTDCPFSHVVAPSKMPVCKYFLKGKCSSENCPYRHVKVNSQARICQQFLKGFCPTGEKCKKVHTLDCPEFISSGQCNKATKCPLRHPAIRRKNFVSNRPIVRRDKNNELPSFISIDNSHEDETHPEEEEEEGKKKKELQIYPKFLVRGN